MYVGRTRNLDSLHLSERSNGLAFSPRHFATSPVRQSKYIHPSVLSPIDGNGPASSRSRVRKSLNVDSGEEKPQEEMPTVTKQPIRSLIPDEVMKTVRPELTKSLALRHRRRQSNTSLKSIASSIRSQKRRTGPKESLITMPPEIMRMIYKDFTQRDLHSVLLASRHLVDLAATLMYEAPRFVSTYRYAQFAHTVSHRKRYGDLVRVLDLSSFGAIPQDLREPQAGWREWKFRNHNLYRLNDEYRMRRHRLRYPPSTSHPSPNPFLESWALSRDIPIGGLCHAIKACTNLTTLNISHLQISDDFIVEHWDHMPTTWTSILFVSDVPKSWTWKPNELRPITPMYIIEQLEQKKYLQTLIASNVSSMTTQMAQRIVERSPCLKFIDFKDSGMSKDLLWTVAATKEQLRETFKDMKEEPPQLSRKRSPRNRWA